MRPVFEQEIWGKSLAHWIDALAAKPYPLLTRMLLEHRPTLQTLPCASAPVVKVVMKTTWLSAL